MRIFSISVFPIFPGLSITGVLAVISITVDSNPISLSSEIIIASTLSQSSSTKYFEEVIDGLPEILADGAAIDTPAKSISFLAIGFDGILIATVINPPVVSIGTLSDLSNISVSGPGQKASIRSFASWLIFLARKSTSSFLEMCTISGLSDGLPFAS